MVLEVGGSSPLIYPITVFEFELVLRKPNKIFLTNNLRILSNSYKILFNMFNGLEVQFLQKYLFILSTSSSWFTLKKSEKPISSPLFSRNNNLFKSSIVDKRFYTRCKLFKIFKLFISTTYYNSNSSLNKSYVFRDVYYFYGTKFRVISLDKIFISWKNYHYLLFNIFFYNIKVLTFSNSFFIKETNSLNFFLNKANFLNFRHINPFIFFKLGQIIDYGDTLFRKLRYGGVSTSLVVDTIQHAKTLYYLRGNKFFNIGLVTPSSYSKYLDVYLPVGSNSLFTQLFVMRYFLILKKQASFYSLREKITYWNRLKSKFMS